MNIVYKRVDELIPYANNTKKHDKTQINNVATSIDKYGFVQPIVIDKNNVVIIGHCRLLGAKQLNMETVPCVCAHDRKKNIQLENAVSMSGQSLDVIII